MSQPQADVVHEIKKYPNRRFYDATSRRHVTLNELYDLVREGGQIAVTDSRTGQDITNVVLTQIILEHDPPKLDLFPAPLLHQAIQANQQLVRRFIDEYFANAMNAFVNSSKQFDAFVRQAGLSALPASPFEWARRFFGGMQGGIHRRPPGAAAPEETSGDAASAEGNPDSAAGHDSDSRDGASSQQQAIAAMQRQLETLRAELAAIRPRSRGGGRRGAVRRKSR